MDRVALFDQLTIPQLVVLIVALTVIVYAFVVDPLWTLAARRIRRWRGRRQAARERQPRDPRTDRLLAARRASLDLAVRLDGSMGRVPRMPDHDVRVDRSQRRIIH